jgi:hypothetical protein
VYHMTGSSWTACVLGSCARQVGRAGTSRDANSVAKAKVQSIAPVEGASRDGRSFGFESGKVLERPAFVFSAAADTGLTTNVFTTDPRLFGIGITKNW